MVERLEVHGDDRWHARGHLAHVVDAHDDEAAFRELRAARIDDRDSRTVPLDRLRHCLVPDRVAGEVEAVEHEPADRRERLRDRSRPVPCRRSRDAAALPTRARRRRSGHRARAPGARPRPRAGRRPGCRAAAALRARASRWSLCRWVTITASRPRTTSSAANGSGTVGLGTGFAVPPIGGRAPTSSSIGSTRIRLPSSSRIEGRAADEREPHAGFLADVRALSDASDG